MRTPFLFPAILALAWLLQPVGIFAGDIIYPITRRAVPVEQLRPDIGFKSDVSRRNILGLERPAPFALPKSKRGLPIAESALLEDTLRVLGLKVEFQSENPDNPLTTGNGNFDMRSFEQFRSEEGHYIDPAPHGTAYFNSHLEALRRYWYFVSDRTLNLTWDVYPQDESTAFRLPVTMSYYGSQWPDTVNNSIGDRLGTFFIDAIRFADTNAPEIDFSSYDAVIVFHAGSDQQNNIAFINDTPDDFYTGFLRLAHPIWVDDSTYTVMDGTIMPETASQDNRVTALNGVMAHEFGHQLGLVDLYNTKTFMTQVGDFSLMDNNAMSVGVQFEDIYPTIGGTLPVFPDAWSRAYLGFNVPREMALGDDEIVSAALLEFAGEEIIKVPITEFEYFLIENRQQVNPYTALVGDPVTGVILGPGYLAPGDIITPNAEYDLLLPGNGMLIWHVDETVAYDYQQGFEYNNFYSNALQWNKDRRFVSLVEADGIIDFGGNYYRGFGDDNDFFKDGNQTMLIPGGRPSSRSNLGGDTHISITNISATDTLMSVDISNDWLVPGWPRMSRPNNITDPVTADLDGDGSEEVIIGTPNQLLIWRGSGAKFIANNDSVGIMRYDSSYAIYPLAVAAEFSGESEGNIAGRPMPLDFDGDDIPEIVLAAVTGNIFGFYSRDEDNTGRLDTIPGFTMGLYVNGISSFIAVDFLSRAGMELLVIPTSGGMHLVYSDLDGAPAVDSLIATVNGTVAGAAAYTAEAKNFIDYAWIDQGTGAALVTRLSADTGSLAFTQQFSISLGTALPRYIASGDIDRDGMADIVIITSDGVKLVGQDGRDKWNISLDDTLGAPALGDINSDGYPDIVFCGTSRIYAFNYSGSLLGNFPINMGLYDLPDQIEASPVLGDVDGDNNPDIIVGLPGGSIYAFNSHGERVGGFPLPSSLGVTRSCALGNLDSDSRVNLVTVENSGFVKVWNIDSPYSSANNPWSAAGGSRFNNSYLSPEFLKAVVSSDEQLPGNSVYNYPNPARNFTAIRYYLNSDSKVKIDIYDYMGESVHSAEVSGLAHADNEYVWDCSEMASGLYFCRVEAESGAGSNWRMIKIAVVK